VNYLVDTSALIRIGRRQVDPAWHEVVDRGLAALCEPVLVETLTATDSKHYSRVEDSLRTTYPWVPVPDDAWSVAREVQRELAALSQHRGLSVADFLVIRRR